MGGHCLPFCLALAGGGSLAAEGATGATLLKNINPALNSSVWLLLGTIGYIVYDHYPQ